MRITSENTSGQAGVESEFILTKSVINYTHSDIENQFRQAMQTAGINYSGEIIADSKLHRFHIEGHKRGSNNGAYVLHADKFPAGWFMDYKSGLSQTWKSSSDLRISHDLLKQINEAKQQREAELRQNQEAAANKAKYIWGKSKPVTHQEDHAYLVKKRIQPLGARISSQSLVIPLRDESKKIINLQFIDVDGNKRFLFGGRKKGCFYPIGQPTPRILITEGFATGASLHEETGQCVIVAFDAGNLKPVAKIIRNMFPATEIIICGDNDLTCIGQCAAREAAIAINALVLIPDIPGKDWNDVLSGGSHD